MAQRQPATRVLEEGNILFLYRPKQGVLHPKSPEDIERAYLMLLPDDQNKHMNRIFNVAHGVFPAIAPGKALPEERDWALVQDVDHDPKAVLQRLQKNIEAQSQSTGQRARPWARVAGEGRYSIARHEDHTHLAYHLREPEKAGKVQKELEVKPQASYVIAVKEPFAPSEIELEEKPSYPESLRKKFDDLSFIPTEPTDFLDYQWTQVLLVGARENVEKELGIKLNAEVENKAERQVMDELHKEEKRAARIGVSILEPIETGRWE